MEIVLGSSGAEGGKRRFRRRSSEAELKDELRWCAVKIALERASRSAGYSSFRTAAADNADLLRRHI